MKRIIKNMYNERNSTSLVGIIGVLIITVSIFGNGNLNSGSYAKASIFENNQISSKSNHSFLSVGEQTVIIGGQEYEISVNPKY